MKNNMYNKIQITYCFGTWPGRSLGRTDIMSAIHTRISNYKNEANYFVHLTKFITYLVGWQCTMIILGSLETA